MNTHQRAVYHITSIVDWQKARAAGSYTADSLHSEGFIHCSTGEQVLNTARRYYSGQRNLLLLEIDPASLQSRLQYDPVPDHGVFPHIYGPLNLEAVIRVWVLDAGSPQGEFSWPDQEYSEA